MILIAVIALIPAFVFPLWDMTFTSNQYLDGLTLNIYSHKLEGGKTPARDDLREINALNHYIGMKAIEPDAIPELKIMPWVVAALVAGALLVAASGRRKLLGGWLAAFLILGLVGLVDFWRWEYDYGHNLDPEAIISIPGMSYQPPLIGVKQIANFTASAWPASGGTIIGLAALATAAAVWIALRATPRRAVRTGAPGQRASAAGTVAA